MRRPQHHAKPVMTVGQSTAQLRMLLVGCSDNALAAMTAESLASMYRVKPLDAMAMLREQRAHRASRV
jgi:hypothetical protein